MKGENTMKDYITASLDRLTERELRLLCIAVGEFLKDKESPESST